MTYTFTHDELFNPKFNASTIIVLSVLKTLLNENEIVCNNDLFERLPISEKTIYRSIKTLKENGIILDKKGKRKSKMKPSEIKNEKMKLIYELSITMKHQEIADKLEMPRSTVTDNVTRYRMKLINHKKVKCIHQTEINKLNKSDVISSVCICGYPNESAGYNTNWKMVCSSCGKPKQTDL